MADEIDEGVDTDPPLPEALAEAFAANPEAHAAWRKLRRGERWFRIGPISQAKKPETKARRAQAIVDTLALEAAPTMPPELEAVFAADPEAEELFGTLRKRDREDWFVSIASAKKPETRVRRAEKLPVYLRQRVVRKAERKAQGIDDLGGRFMGIVDRFAGADLRAAGFQPMSGSKHWRRVGEHRADFVTFLVHTRFTEGYVTLGLECWTAIPVLQRGQGLTPTDLRRTRTPRNAQGVPVDLPDDGDLFTITADVDEEVLGARVTASIRTAIAALDAVGDVSTLDALLAGYVASRPTLRPAAHLGFGDAEAARAVLLEQAHEAAETRPVRDNLYWRRQADIYGVPVEDLPEGVPEVPRPTRPPRETQIRAELLRRALGATATSCVADTDGSIRLQVVQPTDEQLAEARAIAGDTPLTITVVDVSLEDHTRILRRLQEVLRQREAEREDLVAFPNGWTVGRIGVAVANLDPETEALIRDIVPESILQLSPPSRYSPVEVMLIEKRQRLASAPGNPAIAALATDFTRMRRIDRAFGGDGGPPDPAAAAEVLDGLA